jgi:type I restriction enzyme M protein
VLDTGAVTRGSGSKNENKERNIRKWFVDQDLIDGVILLPDNLFYNTPATGVIVIINTRKSAGRKDKIVLLNASKRVRKGKPKNYIPGDAIVPLAAAYLKGEPVDGEIAVITRQQVEQADYNLSPSTFVGAPEVIETDSIASLLRDFKSFTLQEERTSAELITLLAPIEIEVTP